jgi:hypothetical protein
MNHLPELLAEITPAPTLARIVLAAAAAGHADWRVARSNFRNDPDTAGVLLPAITTEGELVFPNVGSSTQSLERLNECISPNEFELRWPQTCVVYDCDDDLQCNLRDETDSPKSAFYPVMLRVRKHECSFGKSRKHDSFFLSFLTEVCQTQAAVKKRCAFTPRQRPLAFLTLQVPGTNEVLAASTRQRRPATLIGRKSRSTLSNSPHCIVCSRSFVHPGGEAQQQRRSPVVCRFFATNARLTSCRKGDRLESDCKFDANETIQIFRRDNFRRNA